MDKYENTRDKCSQKIWCGGIGGCSIIKTISRNKDKTLQIVPQCGTIRGCSTNRVNTVILQSIGIIVIKSKQTSGVTSRAYRGGVSGNPLWQLTL